EIGDRDNKRERRYCKRDGETLIVEGTVQKRRAEAFDYTCHRIQIEQPPPSCRHKADRKYYWRRVQPNLCQERRNVREVSISHSHGRQESSDSDCRQNGPDKWHRRGEQM